VVVHDEAGLAPHVPAWQELARSALEPNAFYEPWALLPALRAFGEGQDVRFLLIYGHAPRRPGGQPVLCGLFPLQRRRLHRALPLGVVGLWQHLYCFLCTPLVRADCAAPTLAVLFDWLRADRQGAALLELGPIGADGPFARALTDHCNDRLRPTFVTESHTRAVLEPHADAEAYLNEALAGKRRRELRRQERALAGPGRLEYRRLGPGEGPSAWVEAFLRLEAEGWKGRSGSAMACREADAAFFRALTSGAAAQGQLHMVGLFLDERPVALKCNLLSPPGSFAFKIAFDESHARSSPGVLLEVYNLEQFHRERPARWMDSCAEAQHPMINRLWLERRAIQTVLVSTGRRGGDLTVSLLPLGRWLKRRLRRRRPAPPHPDEGQPA
jgi:CelD/BcsL family acetyltransferase involved in cellulose biosynthesis